MSDPKTPEQEASGAAVTEEVTTLQDRKVKEPVSMVPPIVKVEDAKDRFRKSYVSLVTVPSLGYLYDDKFPGGELYMSPMTASEEKILLSNKRDRAGLVDQVVQRCIVEMPIKYEELLLQDFFYLLLSLRNISYGSTYSCSLDCPACRTTYNYDIELPAGLRMTVLTEEDEDEPYEVDLPVSGDRLGWRRLRISDEMEIRRFAKKAYNNSNDVGDPTYCFRIARHLVTLNGTPIDSLEKLEYAENLIASDMNALRQHMEQLDFGARLAIDTECPACGREEETQLPFSREFFRPSNAGR